MHRGHANAEGPGSFEPGPSEEDPAASYSPALICAVPSALEVLTAVFGMGTGGSPPLWPPEIVARVFRDERASASLLSDNMHPS
jgi:hypothetical protein